MGIITSILSGVYSSVVSPLVNFMRGILHRVLGGLFSLPGQILGFVRNLLGNVIGTIGNVLSTGFRMAFQAVGAMVSGLIGAIRSSVAAATEFGKAALSMRSKTGMSYDAAGKVLTKGMAFGMSPSESANAFGNQNPFIGKLLGNNPQSSTYISDLSRERASYANQGPLGLMMWQQMATARGVSPEAQRLAAMDPAKVAAQEKWTNDIGGKMGMSGKDIQMYAEDFQLAMGKVTTVLNLIKLKFASAIGPALVEGLEKVADFFGRNSEKITRDLEHVGKALSGVFLQGLEVGLNFLDANSGKIETWFRTAFDYVIYRLPAAVMMAGAWLLRAGAAISTALGFIVGLFGQGVAYLTQHAPAISNFFNSITQRFLDALPGLQQAFAQIVGFLGDFGRDLLRILGINLPAGGGAAGANGANGANGGGAVGPDGQPVPPQQSRWINNAITSIGQGARNVGNAVGFNTGDPNTGGPANGVINTLLGGAILRGGFSLLAGQLGNILGGRGGRGGALGGKGGGDCCCCCDGNGGGKGGGGGDDGGGPDLDIGKKGNKFLRNAARRIGPRALRGLRAIARPGLGLITSTYSGLTGGATLATAGAGAIAGTTALGLAGGTAVGYGLYRAGQGLGLIDREQGFGDRMATGWGRLRDLATFNSGHYEQTVLAQRAADAKKREAEEKAKQTAAVAAKTAGTAAATTAAAAIAAPTPPVPQPTYDPATGYLGYGAVKANDAVQGGLSFLQQNGIGISASLMGLSKNLTSNGMDLNSRADGMENSANSLLAKMNQTLGGIQANTKKNADSTEKQTEQLSNAFNVWGQSMLNAGRDAAYAVVE